MTREKLKELAIELDRNLSIGAEERVIHAFTEADTGRFDDIDEEIDPECHLPVPFVRGIVEAHTHVTEHDHNDPETAKNTARALIGDEYGSTFVDRSVELTDLLSERMVEDDKLRSEVASFAISQLMMDSINLDPELRDAAILLSDHFGQFVDEIQSDWERQNL